MMDEKTKHIRELFSAFEKQTIRIPSGLKCFQSGRELLEWKLDDIPHLVFYYDSLDCVGCRLQHIINLSPLFQEKLYGREYDIVPIFAPMVEKRDEIMHEAKYALHDYPLYLDFDGSFGKENPFIPADMRFHCFLLDREGHPVFVGDPTSNPKLMRVFRRVARRLQ